MPRSTITDENGDGHFGYGELLKPDVVDALITQHNEHATALDALEGGASSAPTNQYSATHFEWNDDWFIGAQLAQGNGWNGAPIASPPYSITLTGVNTALTPVTGSQRLGVVSLDTGTTNTGKAGIVTASTFLVTWGSITFEATVGFPTLSTGGEEYTAQIGWVGTGAGHEVQFIYDRGNVLAGGPNAGNANKWSVRTMQNGTSTHILLDGGTYGGVVTVDSPVAALSYPNTNLYRLKAVCDGTTAWFYINSVLVAETTSNVPPGDHSLAASCFVLKSAGTTARSMVIDQTRIAVDLDSTRTPQ